MASKSIVSIGDERRTSFDGSLSIMDRKKLPVNMSAVHGLSGARESNKNESPQFPYKPLSMCSRNFEKSEIRLLILKPGLASDSIECGVRNLKIDEAKSWGFRALSYTWGPPDKFKMIILEGINVQVRENLWQALYHLRSPESELRLWIDALSINQDDVDERNNQVSMMGLIYSEAVEVIVWLGREGTSSKVSSLTNELFLSSIVLISESVLGITCTSYNTKSQEYMLMLQNQKLAMEFLQLLEKSTAFSDSALPIEFIVGSTALLEALEHLMGREYWKRTWIIQEILRAYQITIYCGYQTLRWESLVKFFSRVRDTVLEPHEIFKMGPDPIRPRLLNLCESLPARLAQHTGCLERSLEELLETYKDSLSTDPRDKIYSLIGLAGRKLCKDSIGSTRSSHNGPFSEKIAPSLSLIDVWIDWIPIDYSISKHELFRMLVMKFNLEEPCSSLQVKRMKLLQETLGLQPELSPGVTICSDVNFLPLGDGPIPSLSHGCITALGRSHSKVSDCGLFWYHNSRVAENSRESSWLWHDTELISPWLWQCLENAHDDNLKRLNIDPSRWDTTGFQVFVDTRGYLGLGRSCIQVGDRIIHFNDSGIALIVRGTGPVSIIGRALFLNPEAERESCPVMEERITLSLDKWQFLIW